MSALSRPARIPRPNRIARLRQAAGLDQAHLARLLRVSVSTVSRWETAKASVPDHQKLRMAAMFGVTVVYLMGWAEDEEAA